MGNLVRVAQVRRDERDEKCEGENDEDWRLSYWVQTEEGSLLEAVQVVYREDLYLSRVILAYARRIGFAVNGDRKNVLQKDSREEHAELSIIAVLIF